MRINFDLQNTQEYVGGGSFIFPQGDYVVEIVSEEENVRLKSGKGTALLFEYQVMEGPYRGQRYRDWINLGHENEQTRELARRRLKSIGNAVGLPVFGDTRELHRRPFTIAVTKSTRDGKDQNNIEAYRPVLVEEQPTSEAAPSAPRQPSQPQPSAPQGYVPQSGPQSPTQPAQPYGASPWA